MIHKKTWILLGAFLAVLGTYLAWDATRPDQPAVEVTPPPEPLWSVASEDIVRVIIEDLDAAEILEVRRDDEDLWQIIAPRAGLADAARVERAVSWLSSPSPRAELLEVPDLSAFQLDTPLYRVEIVTDEGSKHSFQVGRESPTGGSRYVSVPDRLGVVVLNNYGLNDVLTLREDLLATPTAEATEIEAVGAPTESSQSTDEVENAAEASTLEPPESAND